MMNPENDPVAQMDQAMRACVDVARLAFAFFNALIAEGFTESQALTLTCHQLKYDGAAGA
jgi:hypothetical protein